MFYSQAGQDQFIINVLKGKRNGYFLEIGSNHPSYINNTYKLEKEYDWKGIMIDYKDTYLDLYKSERPNSVHVIQDAREIDYKKLFDKKED